MQKQYSNTIIRNFIPYLPLISWSQELKKEKKLDSLDLEDKRTKATLIHVPLDKQLAQQIFDFQNRESCK